MSQNIFYPKKPSKNIYKHAKKFNKYHLWYIFKNFHSLLLESKIKMCALDGDAGAFFEPYKACKVIKFFFYPVYEKLLNHIHIYTGWLS